MVSNYLSAIVLLSLCSFALCSEDHAHASIISTEHQATNKSAISSSPPFCVVFGQKCGGAAICCGGECIPNGIRGRVCSPRGCKADNAVCTSPNSCCNKNGIICRKKHTFIGSLEGPRCLNCQSEGGRCRKNAECCNPKAICRRVAGFRSKRCHSQCVPKGRRCRRSRDCCDGRKCRRKLFSAKRCR